MGTIKVTAKMDDLGVSLKELTREIADQLTTATAQLARLTYNRAVELAGDRLNSTKQQYLDALKFEPDGEGVFVIYLEESANHLEEGYCVLFNPNLKRTMPKVYTVEGWKFATDLKVGELVLTHDGTFQEILEIHVNDAFEAFQNSSVVNESHEVVEALCQRCHVSKLINGQQVFLKKARCLCKTPEYVIIEYSPKSKKNRRLLLTPDHGVLTQRGWVPAGELLTTDKMLIPNVSVCKRCGKDTAYLENYCSTKCAHPSGPNNVKRLFKNHSGDYKFELGRIRSVTRHKSGNGTNFTKRFDLTVAKNNSYVCQFGIIHNCPFPMLPKLVHGPKSKVAKDGHRYAIIPIRTRTNTASVQPSANSRSLAMKIKEVIDERKFKQTQAKKDRDTGKITTVEKYTGDVPHPFLKGLTRVREYASAESNRPLSSAYLTFRVASEKQIGKGKWNHPGFKGANIFPDIERWANDQMSNIIRDIFGK